MDRKGERWEERRERKWRKVGEGETGKRAQGKWEIEEDRENGEAQPYGPREGRKNLWTDEKQKEERGGKVGKEQRAMN